MMGTITAQDQGAFITAGMVTIGVVCTVAILGTIALVVRFVLRWFVRPLFKATEETTAADEVDEMAEAFGDIPAPDTVDNQVLRLAHENLRLAGALDHLISDRNFWRAEARRLRGRDHGQAA